MSQDSGNDLDSTLARRETNHPHNSSDGVAPSKGQSLEEEEKQKAYALEIMAGVMSDFCSDKLTVDHLTAVCLSSLRSELAKYLGADARLMDQPSHSWSDDELATLQDACYDVLNNDASFAADYEVTQDFGPYLVFVRGVPGAYFIEALERDPLGPFATLNLATDVAELNCSDLITRDLEVTDTDDTEN